MGAKRAPGAKRTPSKTSSKASSGTSSSTIGPNATNAANKGFFSATDQQTAIVLFLLDAILLIGAVVIFISKPTCKAFGSEVKDDVGADGEKIEIQFFGHNPPPFNQFQGSSGGSIKYGGGWLSWPSGNGGNSGFKPPAFVPAVLPPTSYNPWRPTQPSWWSPPYMPPTYPSYPMYPPSYPSYPSQLRPPTYPSHLPPTYPSYPSQPRPPTYPSYPSHQPPSYPSYPSQLRPPTYPSYPSQPRPPTYPSYPSHPLPPSYPSYPSHPLPPSYPSYPSQPRPPTYPSYPSQPRPPTYPSYPQPPTYPSYPLPPTYPSQPRPPTYPSYPSQPRPPTYPSYPSQPRPPTYPSYPGGGGGGASLASPEDQISNTNFQCGIQQTKPSLRSSWISSRIMGGTEPIRHSWPWIASVQRGSEHAYSYHVCGGTVVSPRHVITAAHCMEPLRPLAEIREFFSVYVGRHTGTDGERYPLANSRNHPYYIAKTFKFDLTLFTTRREIQFGPKVQPACLPPRNTYPRAGKSCWAYGWGALETGSGVNPTIQQVNLNVIAERTCQMAFSKVRKVYNVCAGAGVGKDTCQGDSGGPLTCQDNGKWVLYGATSYGSLCGSGAPGVYAATSDSMSWFCCFMEAIPSCRGISCDLSSVPNPQVPPDPAYDRSLNAFSIH